MRFMNIYSFVLHYQYVFFPYSFKEHDMSSTKFIYPTSAVLKSFTNISANQLYQLVLIYQRYIRDILVSTNM